MLFYIEVIGGMFSTTFSPGLKLLGVCFQQFFPGSMLSLSLYLSYHVSMSILEVCIQRLISTTRA